jgi:glucosylceramidase
VLKPTRRNFLKNSGLTFAALATGKRSAAGWTSVLPASAPGSISSWITDSNQQFTPGTPVPWRILAIPTADALVFNAGKQYQDILGFGGAFTDASCFMFNELSSPEREKLFHELFDSSRMGLNVCRTCIGSSDYSTKMYSYDEGEVDPDLARFSIEQDRAYILPMLREARKVNPDLFLFSSPWSPPGWMKATKSMLGGSMRREFMPSYARYFAKFVQSYAAEGVPVQAVTVQNEVDTDQDGRMPACIWPQEYEADFVRNHLGPALRQTGVSTKIWLIDHNYNLWGRALGELETPGVRDYANAIAWHGYVGRPEWIDRVQQVYPNVEMFWTEGGPEYTAPNYATDWVGWSTTFTGILRHYCRSITVWNLALDEQGRPNLGPFHCGGLVTINSQSKAITYSGQFRALAHYSRCIHRGARVVDTQNSTPDLFHVGFVNPDGKRVLVLTNPGAARTCNLREGEKECTLPLTGDSVTTVEWSV